MNLVSRLITKEHVIMRINPTKAPWKGPLPMAAGAADLSTPEERLKHAGIEITESE